MAADGGKVLEWEIVERVVVGNNQDQWLIEKTIMSYDRTSDGLREQYLRLTSPSQLGKSLVQATKVDPS